MGKAIQLCCCCTLRTGSIIIGVLLIIGALSYLGLASVAFEGTQADVSPILLLAIFIVKLVAGILLICGATMRKVGPCYIWMVFVVIEMILDILAAALFFLAATAIELAISKSETSLPQEEANGYFSKGVYNVLQCAVLFYYFYVVLNFTYEVKENEEGGFGPEYQGYPSGMQIGSNAYAPNYNPYPSYAQQGAMYPQGQGPPSQQPSTHGYQNYQTGAPTPD